MDKVDQVNRLRIKKTNLLIHFLTLVFMNEKGNICRRKITQIIALSNQIQSLTKTLKDQYFCVCDHLWQLKLLIGTSPSTEQIQEKVRSVLELIPEVQRKVFPKATIQQVLNSFSPYRHQQKQEKITELNLASYTLQFLMKMAVSLGASGQVIQLIQNRIKSYFASQIRWDVICNASFQLGVIFYEDCRYKAAMEWFLECKAIMEIHPVPLQYKFTVLVNLLPCLARELICDSTDQEKIIELEQRIVDVIGLLTKKIHMQRNSQQLKLLCEAKQAIFVRFISKRIMHQLFKRLDITPTEKELLESHSFNEYKMEKRIKISQPMFNNLDADMLEKLTQLQTTIQDERLPGKIREDIYSSQFYRHLHAEQKESFLSVNRQFFE